MAAHRRGILIACALFASACASDDPPAGNGSPEPTGPALTACLDAPGALEFPPQGSLPCELIPPGLTLK